MPRIACGADVVQSENSVDEWLPSSAMSNQTKSTRDIMVHTGADPSSMINGPSSACDLLLRDVVRMIPNRSPRWCTTSLVGLVVAGLIRSVSIIVTPSIPGVHRMPCKWTAVLRPDRSRPPPHAFRRVFTLICPGPYDPLIAQPLRCCLRLPQDCRVTRFSGP